MAPRCKAPRNKTIELTPKQTGHYAALALRAKKKFAPEEIENKIIFGDSLEIMPRLPEQCVDLLIVDPPYNLTKTFGENIFRQRDFDTYKQWLDRWLRLTVPLLKENASVYICADWKTSLAIPEVAGRYFILRNRISWEREKGRGAKNNWKNCLEDIWFFTKSDRYIFNLDAVKIQRPVIAPYRDKTGHPKDWQEIGHDKLRWTHPSNVWTDISIPFWSMRENTPHPTHKPEKLMAKLILASSDPGGLVFDPFVGSGTTAVAAKKLGRKFLGIEQEKEYVALACKRLEMADEDSSIQGFENGLFKARNT